MNETWKSISGYEGLYEVSSLGRVQSLPRTVTTYSARGGKTVPMRRKGMILATNVNIKNGYLSVCLCKNGLSKTKRIAGLVCQAFYGNRPLGMDACHNNGDKRNNTKKNLRWDTKKSNQADRILHGTDLRGEKIGTSKFTARQIEQVKAGMSERDAMELFGISHSQYYRIKNGKSWAHVGAMNGIETAGHQAMECG